MQISLVLLSILIVFSLAANAALFLRLKKKPKKEETYDARELIHDLTAGSAIVRIQRIAPTDMFLRSPRDL